MFGQLTAELTCNGLRQIFTELLTCSLNHRANTFDQVVDPSVRHGAANEVIQQCPDRSKSVHLVHGFSHALGSKLSTLIGGQHAQHLRTGTNSTDDCITSILVQSITLGTNGVSQQSGLLHDDFVRPINTTSSFAGQLVDEHFTVLHLLSDTVLQGINGLLHILAGTGNTSHAIAQRVHHATTSVGQSSIQRTLFHLQGSRHVDLCQDSTELIVDGSQSQESRHQSGTTFQV